MKHLSKMISTATISILLLISVNSTAAEKKLPMIKKGALSALNAAGCACACTDGTWSCTGSDCSDEGGSCDSEEGLKDPSLKAARKLSPQ